MDNYNYDSALQVFGQVHELSDAIERRLAARRWVPLALEDVGGKKLSNFVRRQLQDLVRPRVCTVLDGIEEQENLSSHSRLLVRICLSKPQHFIGIVLHHFYERGLFESLLSHSEKAIVDLYGDFVDYARQNNVGLRRQLNELHELKDQFAKMRRQLNQAYRQADLYVHDVSYTPYTAEYTSLSLGRRIVIDPPDPTRFLHDSFYVMNSVDSFVVQPMQSRCIEMHLFVTEDCPYDVEGLKKMIRADSELDGTDAFDNDWLTLIVVYNLHTVPIVDEWMLKARSHLEENVRQRRYVRRSPDKEDRAVKGVYPSRMVGLGDVANQSGGVGPYHNFQNPQMTAESKYELLRNTDFVLDGLIMVNLLFLSAYMILTT